MKNQEIRESEDLAKQTPLIENGYPNINDIFKRLRFDPETGSIWLHDERAILLRASIYGQLRAQFIRTLGEEEAKKMFTTLGYKAGQADAALALKIRGKNDREALIAAGHQIFGMEGGGALHIQRFEADPKTGKFLLECIWTSSLEDEVHIDQFGIGHDSACWYSTGYGSAFMSVLMGKYILVKEAECRAVGNSRCRFIGRPIDEWEDDIEKDLSYFVIPELMNLKSKKRPKPAKQLDYLIAEKPNPADPEISTELVGNSAGFTATLQRIKKVATTDATVLFIGETGVGKEIFSKTLHNISLRADHPLIAVNCAAIPDDLLESELFGVERGAFTGASVSRPGRFERADGGTLFLDEISSLNLPAQGKLLRVLQEGEVERLGGTATKKVDVRIIAATNLDLKQEVEKGNFREDLFYRLNVFPVHILPLRSRREDIPMLANNFFVKYSRRHGRQPSGFTKEAIEALLSYEWPGNIRELENLVERAVVLAMDEHPIHVSHLFTSGEHISTSLFSPSEEGALTQQNNSTDWDVVSEELLEKDKPLEIFQSMLIKKALQRENGNVSKASRILGISRGQLDYWLRKEST